MKKIPFLALFLLFFLYTPASGATPPLLIEAEKLELAADGTYLLAEGRVMLVYGELTLRAQRAIYQEGKVTAEGEVVLSAGQDLLHAARLTVDLGDKAISGEEVHGHLNGYFIRAKSLNPVAAGGMELKETALTRCDRTLPCYEFRADRLLLEGRRVTVERAWLVLLGRRLTPLPNITLDLDRLDEWPSLAGGYDERGLYLNVSFTMALQSHLALVLAGEFSTGAGASFKIATPWRPDGKMKVEPWLAFAPAKDVQLGLAITGPSWNLDNGAMAVQGYWKIYPSGPEEEISEAGLAIRWSRNLSPEENDEIGLVVGRRWGPTADHPLLSLRVASSRRVNENWGVALSCRYNLAAGSWEEAELAGIRYFHCYFVRFGLDLLTGEVRLSGGIRF
ncbi:MAG: hypothetical protein ACUVRM_02270 [Bacillota bacterium]